VGWVPRVLKEVKVILAHFYTLATVTKTNTDTFSQCFVHCDMFVTQKEKRVEIRCVFLHSEVR